MNTEALSLSSLSPAQVLVLNRPNARQGDELIRVTLRWLVARGHLVMAPSKGHASQNGEQRITPGTLLPPGAAADLAQVMALALAKPRHKVSAVMRAARRAWGRNYDGFRRDVVLPGLLAQGLVLRRDTRLLLIFPQSRTYRTAAGEALNLRLTTLLSKVRALPDMMTSDPPRAAAIAASAGGLVLLVPEMVPHLASLGDLLRGMPPRRHDPAVNATSDPLGFSVEDLGGFDLSICDLDASIDEAASESSDASGPDGSAATASGDASGGEGGGGDGAGGDGGGGGGGD